DYRRRKLKRFSTRNQVSWVSQGSVTTCAISSAATNNRHGFPLPISSIAPHERSVVWRPYYVESTGSCSPPGSARTPPKCAAESVMHQRGSASHSLLIAT